MPRSVRHLPHVALALAMLATAGCGEGRTADAATADRPRHVATIEGFAGPESVKYDADQDVWFVSNMLGAGSNEDGRGYIVRIDAATLDGMQVLVEGGRAGAVLDAPKGMALHGDTLWVADIHVLRAFDRRSGAPLATVDLSPNGAVLLNDVAVGPDGRIYVTDTGIIMSDKGVLYPGGDKIFVVGPGRAVSLQAQGPALAHPNGITWDSTGKRWVIVTFHPFHSEAYAMRPGDTTRTVIAKGNGRYDGVEYIGNGEFLLTSWPDSSVHLVSGGTNVPVVRNLPQPADLGWDARRRRMAVPLVMPGKIEFWDL